MWNDSTITDSKRLDAIAEIACDGYLYSQPDSAFHFAQIQFNYAKKRYLFEDCFFQLPGFDIPVHRENS